MMLSIRKMQSIDLRYIISRVLMFLILASGCATFKTPVSQKPIWEDTSAILRNIEGKAQNLSLQQIQDTLISNNSKLSTFRANAEMILTTPDNNGPIRCKG